SSPPAGRRILTSGSEMTTRFGLVRERTSKSTGRSSNTTNRVGASWLAILGFAELADAVEGRTINNAAQARRTVPRRTDHCVIVSAASVRTLYIFTRTPQTPCTEHSRDRLEMQSNRGFLLVPRR